MKPGQVHPGLGHQRRQLGKLDIDMGNIVLMVMEHAECAGVDGKDIRELLNAIDDPLAPMFIAFAGKCI
jgi:hypothetical protein